MSEIIAFRRPYANNKGIKRMPLQQQKNDRIVFGLSLLCARWRYHQGRWGRHTLDGGGLGCLVSRLNNRLQLDRVEWDDESCRAMTDDVVADPRTCRHERTSRLLISSFSLSGLREAKARGVSYLLITPNLLIDGTNCGRHLHHGWKDDKSSNWENQTKASDSGIDTIDREKLIDYWCRSVTQDTKRDGI